MISFQSFNFAWHCVLGVLCYSPLWFALVSFAFVYYPHVMWQVVCSSVVLVMVVVVWWRGGEPRRNLFPLSLLRAAHISKAHFPPRPQNNLLHLLLNFGFVSSCGWNAFKQRHRQLQKGFSCLWELSPQKAPSTTTHSHSHPHTISCLVKMNYDTKSMAHLRLSFTWWWKPGFDTSLTSQLILSRRFPAKISFPWKFEESLLLSPDIAFVISILYFQSTALYDTPNIVFFLT